MANNTILVTGGTGKTGRRVAALLQEQGHDVRAVSRSTPVPFDWSNEATWPAALDEVESIYVVTTDLYDPKTTTQFRDFGRLAVEHGATRAVMISVPDDGQSGVGDAGQQLTDAGLGLTMLRLRWFNQNFSEDFLTPAVLSGDLRLPAGTGAEAFVDADDIAAVAAAALTDSRHVGRDYELTGPRLLTFDDVAREISEATARPLTYTALSKGEYISEQIESGVPAEWAEFSAYLYESIASGALQTTTTHIEEVLGRPARDFRDFALDAAAHGAWDAR
jgi:uncharacterized protein YbjT (DUF2867 family)